MPVDLVDVHRRALDHTHRFVAAVTGDQWSEPSVCDGWTVRELVNHVVSGNRWVSPLVDGKTIEDVGDKYDGDVLGDDPAGAYDASAKVAGDAFAEPGALERPVAVSYGPVPGSVYAGHRFIDVLIHGWDVAKSTGQDTTLDPHLVSACEEVIAPQRSLLRGSGMFGNDVDVPPDADPQTKLLAELGRQA